MAANIILITQPHFVEGEARILNELFANGLELLHLRKPQAKEGELRGLIAQIDGQYRQRIVVHSHFHLVGELGLRGAHLGSNRRLDVEPFKGQLSFSCHSLAEVQRHKCDYEYVFLSPIFDSISKQGYTAAFSVQTILTARAEGVIDRKVIALGGVTPERAREALVMGFGGVAVLGDIWLSDDPVRRFLEYEN